MFALFANNLNRNKNLMCLLWEYLIDDATAALQRLKLFQVWEKQRNIFFYVVVQTTVTEIDNGINTLLL